MYKERMTNYYPQVISAISEFKAIVDAEYPEFELMEAGEESILNDAYLLTMGEDRIKQWEQILGITPLPTATLSNRRDTITARIRGQGKLNSALINSIVNAFTGGTANSWVKDSILYVEITPPPGNKSFMFADVEQELAKKVPAHLGFQVSRNYYDWGEIKADHVSWQEVKDSFATWNDVYLFSPFGTRKVIR